ncbi:UbiA family prenyltransferase [Candidatus Micrarchaeota archaeon]|nr:UbiA family prenyltransferase [Candidatus Micrarchaeota archaeon]MBU2477360.1 UbiA family prenyltransferase [Candidatus Micrarchaeota archaeon]
MNLTEFIKIIRPIDCIIAALGAFIGYSLSIQSIAFNELILYAMLTVFFVCAGGQTINDFFDYSIDKKTNKNKPLVKGTIKRKDAMIFAFILFGVGIGFGFAVSELAAIVTVFFALILILYSALMKKIKYFGNFVVSFSVAFTILFGAIISMNFFLPLILFVAAFFANTSREIIKDLEDLGSEQGIKITLPQLMPKKAIYVIVLLFYVVSVGTGFYPYFLGLFNSLIYFGLMILAMVFFALSLHSMEKGKFSASQKYSKIGMLAGLIAFLAGVL